jgi:hypothetical protein
MFVYFFDTQRYYIEAVMWWMPDAAAKPSR